jgi:Suppressor of forked protein (Suf)./HAT (Half-A-TPR) repeat.
MDQDNNMVLMRAPKPKNKGAAPIQVTAEQILKDAQIHQTVPLKPTQQRIMDEEELDDYKYRKRKEFEDRVRSQKHHINLWIKYALWEESLQEFRRARSIFERAIDVDYKNVSLWLKYAEMEMRHKFINHARNVWERAIHYLPRVDQFWYKYAYMEEMLGNYNKARAIFENWMSWNPEENAWIAYLKFEQRLGETENCRRIMYRYLESHPRLKTYLKVAKFEEKNKNKQAARDLYERTLEDLGEEAMKEEYFLAFAKFEIRNREIERARQIYRYGLENIPKDKAYKLYDAFVNFEKQYGSKEEIDDLILDKRRIYYRELLSKNPLNYDAWFDLTNLELSTKNLDRIRECFENAIANVPPKNEKRFWRRYIYIWINYAMFEELDANNIERTKSIYERVLKLVPHKEFTFSKLWVMYAHFYIRCKNVEQARKVFGTAIGKCPNEKIFKAYAELELQLANIDRCRVIYEKFIEVFPDNPNAWIKYAELEKSLEEYERCRAIYELAIQQTVIDMPETIWKAYIDTEVSLEEYDRARELYLRLLEKTKHVKVWLSYAQFEYSRENYDRMREILQDAENYFKENPDLKEVRE